MVAALAVVNALLLAPDWLVPGGPRAHWIALESVVVVGAFALLPARAWSRIPAALVSVAVVVVGVLALGDAMTRAALDRPLNIYLDVRLLGAVRDLLGGTVGPVAGGAVLLGALSSVPLLAWALARLLTRIRIRDLRLQTRLGGAALLTCAVVGLGLSGGGAGTDGEGVLAGRVALPTVTTTGEQAARFLRTLGERERFRSEVAAVPAGYADVPGLLERLGGRTVILAFVESYGISALYDERYGAVIRPRLDELERRARDAGLHLATGKLVAPTQGGQSWFSHGSLLSGIWLDDQLRYDLLLASGRETLVDDFRRAGYRTVALMPAITASWPEGERLGYDRVYGHLDIGYEGPPLNWVTMPDQFTWSFLQNTIRADADPRPLFAEVGLISSHAPWTPILPVLDDWDGIGDGSVFDRWKGAGEPPRELWLDHDRVREHFALAVDYALDAMTGYAERYVDDETLLIVMGDHQPAPLITGEGAGRAVPVHVISGDPGLVEPFRGWGFREGALPDREPTDRGMDRFRDWFVRAFSRGEPRRG